MRSSPPLSIRGFHRVHPPLVGVSSATPESSTATGETCSCLRDQHRAGIRIVDPVVVRLWGGFGPSKDAIGRVFQRGLFAVT